MTFAQALARIEELLKEQKANADVLSTWRVSSALRELLHEHADNFIQLGKVAQEMRADFDACTIVDGPGGGIEAYDKLMKGDEGWLE